MLVLLSGLTYKDDLYHILFFYFSPFLIGVSMGYMQENSYSNSNNGGSVNSQDSLWQLKMGGVNSGVNTNSGHLIPNHNNYADRQPSYSYDPLTHGGYRVVDDYAPYPTLQTPSSQVDDYHNMRNSQNPSRQDYSSSEPYAAVHKPKKRLDQHIGRRCLIKF